MIGLILTMLRARLGRALTALALAVVAVAAAVAGPAFLTAADRSVTVNELSRAPASELAIEATSSVSLGQGRDQTFESTAPALLSGPGLSTVFAAEFDAYLKGPRAVTTPRLVFREGVCDHVQIVSGRCPIGTNEIMLGEQTAARLGVHSGQTVLERESIQTKEGPTPVGPPAFLSVVGVYRVADTSARYWADHYYFDASPGIISGTGHAEPAFTTRGTMQALSHQQERQSVDALLDPAALTSQDLGVLKASVFGATNRAKAGQITASTAIPALFARIDADESALREVVPLAAIPLVILAWLVMLLAVGYATEIRRSEVGLLKLRGTSVAVRWWLVLGETTVAILVGSVLGYLTGYAAVAVAARLLLSGAGPVTPSWQPLRWAGVALLGTLVATVLATRRPFAAPVAELLRQVPSRAGAWRGLVLEAMIYPVAVAAVIQLRTNPGRLTGVMLLAPGLVVLAVALLAARLVAPAAGWIGGRALRRGRIGPALGALRLARRPGTARLLALLVVAIAQLSFAVTLSNVAGQADGQRSVVEEGASTVLDVGGVEVGTLLNAVRAADPTGRYAMAVTSLPSLVKDDAPTLAVDSTRLAAVTNWLEPAGGLSAAKTAALLHPSVPAPVMIKSEAIGVDLTANELDQATELDLIGHLASADDGSTTVVNLGRLLPGRHRYAAQAPDCRDGCRLMGFEVSAASSADFDFDIVVHGIDQGDPGTPLDIGLTRAGSWRTPAPTDSAAVPELTPGSDGLEVRQKSAGIGVDAWFLPVDAPYPLPVVSTGRLGRSTLAGLDQSAMPVVSAGIVTILPRLGDRGIMVDFEYAERDARDVGPATKPQVWLAADAPAGLVDRLRQQGLSILDRHTDTAQLRYLDRQGPATGLRFHLLAGALSVLLALGGLVLIATVDRRAAGQLRALRVQGVPRAAVAAANRYGYLGLVLAALVLGPLAALVAWLLTGTSIPLFADGVQVLPPPLWPHWSPVLLAWAAAGVAMTAVALVSSRIISAGLDARRRERE
ncbi:hypothetical protein GCM10023322_19030 [Rugosimonospora acidiphila]|uniref:ABC3 transporter permease C-terminal domain-containing protein n=1 Tax=Rugosimonospora acidiphila TaxID=556531 RepID=A0ABP9RNE7_9ACTN